MMSSFFFFNDTATTEIYTLSLHDALPIYHLPRFACPLRRALLLLCLSDYRIQFPPAACGPDRVRFFPPAILTQEKVAGTSAPDSPRPSRRPGFDGDLRGSGPVSRSGHDASRPGSQPRPPGTER